MTEQAKLYCNITALNPVERAHYQELTNKLALNRRNAIEIARGYEFQFNASAISLADLAEWVAYESKCCLFLISILALGVRVPYCPCNSRESTASNRSFAPSFSSLRSKGFSRFDISLARANLSYDNCQPKLRGLCLDYRYIHRILT